MKFFHKTHKNIYNKGIKRMLDFIFAILLFLILIPVYVIISIVILIKTGRPILYRAERGGYKGKTFRIYKFRTMVKNADKIGGGTSAYNDKRITKVGRFLRRSKLDEIPQLINIIKGEMSFVGPRPELLKYTNNYQGDEKKITMVRPGLTDYASILIEQDKYVGEVNADVMYQEKVLPIKNKLRIFYIENMSLITDCKIVYLTIVYVIRRTIQYIKKEYLKQKRI